jgi:hypothetical protein
MLTCSLCHFETELDDVQIRLGQYSVRCICLRCFARETGSGRPVPRDLRRQVVALLGC